MILLALDPGTTQTGFVRYDPVPAQVLQAGVLKNEELLQWITNGYEHWWQHILAIEQMAGMGMAVGQEVLETCVWTGMFMQAWPPGWREVVRVKRAEVKLHLCGQSRAKDANVRQAIIDLFPATGGGKVPQIGSKNHPGPLYGVASHAWPALGVALTAYDRLKNAPKRRRRARL